MVKGDSKTSDYYVNGLHQPIIGSDLFNNVQCMLEGKSIARNFAKAMCSKPELPLRGLFICNNCGHNLTGSASKSRNGQRHFYYHCNYCKEVRISAEFVAEKMNSILAEIKFSKQAKDLYNVIIKKLLKTHVEKSKRSPGRIELEIKKSKIACKRCRTALQMQALVRMYSINLQNGTSKCYPRLKMN